MQTVNYLQLSAIVYENFDESVYGKSIGHLVDKKLISEDRLNSAELSVLKDASSPLRSYVLISSISDSVSGFQAAAFRSPSGEIIFGFKGTDTVFGLPVVPNDALTDIAIATLAPDSLILQFQRAKSFVFETLNKHGSVCYSDEKTMLDALGQGSNVSFTGHSLGGGIAQYLTYSTADAGKGDSGVKSVTFNAVGVGQNIWSSEVWEGSSFYNSEDHVNSGDMTGNYGVQLGRTVWHIAKDDIDYTKIDFNLLKELLVNRYEHVVRGSGGIEMETLGRLSKANQETINAYKGYIGRKGGFSVAGHHDLSKLLDSEGKMTSTVSLSDGQRKAYNMMINEIHGLVNALNVIETAKKEGNYIRDSKLIFGCSLIKTFSGVEYYSNQRHGILGTENEGILSLNKYSYTHDQIAYANYIIQQFERKMLSGNFASIFADYQEATTAAPVDPLILDLNNNGISTTSLESSQGYFDLDANGFAERTAWIEPGDGLLVLDRNGDGKITNGQELFGDQTLLANGTRATSGFEALREFDENGDGKIDSSDSIFSKLRIWQDANGDGISQAEELKVLADFDIAAINLNSTIDGAVDVMGNIQQRLGSFIKSDGTSGQIAEYLLNRDALDSRDILGGDIEIPSDILDLPNIQGSGNVTSLHAAMAKDETGELKQLVQDFINPENFANRNQIFENIVFKWAAAENIAPDSRGSLIDARHLAALEAFMGTKFVGANGANPNNSAAPILEQAYKSLTEKLYGSLASATYLKDLIDKVSYTFDSDGVDVDLSEVQAEIDAVLVNDKEAGKRLLGDFMRVVYGAGLNVDKIMTFGSHYASQSSELARIVYGANPAVIAGSENSDSLNGSARDDLLYGDAGDDNIYGNAGNDTLVGGLGKDYLYGGKGNDVYIFNRGDGQDIIEDAEGLADEIRLGHESTGVVFKRVNYDLQITVPGYLDSITVSSWYRSNTYKIETFKSSDGYQITHTQVENLIQAMSTFQQDSGTTWEQALTTQPAQVHSILQEYWTVPGS